MSSESPESQSDERLGRFADVLWNDASLISDDEVVVEVEDVAWLGFRLGRLVVTNRRVAFLMGGIVRRPQCVASVPFNGFVAATAGEDRFGEPILFVAGDEELGPEWRLEFDVGSRERAEELEKVIDEQKRLFDERGLQSSTQEPVQEPEATPELGSTLEPELSPELEGPEREPDADPYTSPYVEDRPPPTAFRKFVWRPGRKR